jgi:2-C-methyl-D-erythritol 4-phosphate cytidylyltransferase
VIAAPPGEEVRCREILAAQPGLGGDVVSGGATRADSVSAALEASESELVLVHDAARPLTGPEVFDAVAARLAAEPEADAVIAATPLLDTVKRSVVPHGVPAETGEAVETVPRERLWAAQTPQGFRSAALAEAQRAAGAEGRLAEATDEARLIEQAGGRVLLEPVPAHNIKVTVPADLRLAEALLAASGRV